MMFREFVSDLFPNDVVSEGIISVLENQLVFSETFKECSFDILTFLEEIRIELKKDVPNMELLRDSKMHLARELGKYNIADALEKELAKTSG